MPTLVGDMNAATSALFQKMLTDYPEEAKSIVDEGVITDAKLDALMLKRKLYPYGSTHTKLNKLWQHLRDPTKESPPFDLGDIGNLTNTYEIIKELGRGSYGMVLHARNLKQSESDLALKLFDASVENVRISAYEEANIQRWLNEEYGMHRVHRNLLECYGHFTTTYQGKHYIAIKYEYFSGTDLKAIVDQKIPLTFHQILDIGIGILSALAFLHQNGIVHRDVKLQNAMFNIDNNKVYLIDLGFACSPTGNQDGLCSDKPKGTPLYWSPEWFDLEGETDRAVRERILKAADVWATGCILSYLITRQKPSWWNAVTIEKFKENLKNPKIRVHLSLKNQQMLMTKANDYPGLIPVVTAMLMLEVSRPSAEIALHKLNCLRFPEACVECNRPATNQCEVCAMPFCSVACQGDVWERGHETFCTKHLSVKRGDTFEYKYSTAEITPSSGLVLISTRTPSSSAIPGASIVHYATYKAIETGIHQIVEQIHFMDGTVGRPTILLVEVTNPD